MNVNCLSCGHSFDLRDAYDDYDGQVKCFICGSLLTIHTEDGHMKSVDLPQDLHTLVPVPENVQ